jgi:hypothetical protein
MAITYDIGSKSWWPSKLHLAEQSNQKKLAETNRLGYTHVIMHYIFAAILSNLAYAFADNGNGLVSKRNSPLTTAAWAALFGLVLFTLPIPIFFRDELVLSPVRFS